MELETKKINRQQEAILENSANSATSKFNHVFMNTAACFLYPLNAYFNNSVQATSYSWMVNEIEVVSSQDLNHLFISEGLHKVKLIATSTNGCEDETEIDILSALPATNLQIDNLTLTPNGSVHNISLMVANKGNLPIEIFDVIVSAGTDFSISERFNQFLDIGEQIQVHLSSAIQRINASNVCVSIASAYDDVQPDNNEQCASFSSSIIVENPYPNLVVDEVIIRLILPKSDDVQLTLHSTTGHSLLSE